VDLVKFEMKLWETGAENLREVYFARRIKTRCRTHIICVWDKEQICVFSPNCIDLFIYFISRPFMFKIFYLLENFSCFFLTKYLPFDFQIISFSLSIKKQKPYSIRVAKFFDRCTPTTLSYFR